MNEQKRRQVRESAANARGENSVWKNKMEACLNVRANTFFLRGSELRQLGE